MNVLRRLADILSDGSLILWHKRVRPLIDWTRDGGIGQRIVRTAMLAFPAWIVMRTVRAHPKLMWPLAVLWCIAAWRAQRGAPRRPVAPASTESGPAPASDPLDGVSPAEFLRLLRAAIGPHKAVHLVTLVERLTEAHPGPQWDTTHVRQLAAAAGVRISPTVRAPGRGPTVGIYARDIPPLPATVDNAAQGTPVPVVVAGQLATTTPTTPAPTTPTTPDETGSEWGFEVVDDPTNDRHALVKWS